MKKKRLTIGYLAGYAFDYIAKQLFIGITDAAKDFDVNLVDITGVRFYQDIYQDPQTNTTLKLYQKFIQDIRFVNTENIDGLIIWSTSLCPYMSYSEIPDFIRSFKPLPIINISMPIESIPTISMDNYTGMYQVLTHLIEHHGFNKIGFIRGRPMHCYSEERFDAYCKILKKYDIPLNPDLTPPAEGFTKEAGRNAALFFFEEKKLVPGKDIEAIVAASDMMVFGIMDVLNKKGISIPEDIALVGFNNKIEARLASPALTTVEPFFNRYGNIAVKAMCDLINSNPVQDKIIIPTELIIRQSCGCFNKLLNTTKISNGKVPAFSNNNPDTLEISKKQKTNVLNQMLTIFEIDSKEIVFKDLEMLLNFLLEDICFNRSNNFLLFFEEMLSRKESDNISLNIWQEFISLLRKLIFPFLNNNNVTLCEDILQQARILIHQSILCATEVDEITFFNRQFEIVDLGQQLNSAFNIEDLSEGLKSKLPKLDVQGCYIFTFLKPGSNFDELKLLFAYEKGKVLKKNNYVLSRINILNNLQLFKERSTLFIKPLFSQDKLLGYCFFKAGKNVDIILYEVLRVTISVALRGALIIEERERIQEERDRLYEEAVRANTAKSQFLANMSHEIRTPLNAVIGLNYLLEKTELSNIQEDYVKKVKHSAQNLLNNINDLLDFSKIEAGKLTIELAPFNLLDVLRNIIGIMSIKTKSKGLALKYTIDTTIPIMLISDQFRLEQILLNLIGNAIKFTEKGEVRIGLSLISKKKDKAMIKFSVTDTGIGLTEDQKDKLFQPFVQADVSTTRKFGGTGLGLSISKKLIELLGGSIGIKSNINKGSTFFFTINLDIQKDTIPEYAPSLFKQKQIKILYIDDSEAIQSQMESLFATLSIKCNKAATKNEIDRYLTNNSYNSYHSIIIEYQLHGIKIEELIKNIKKNSTISDIPVILLVPFGNRKALSLVDQYRIESFLIKPFTKSLLFNTILEVLGLEESTSTNKRNKSNGEEIQSIIGKNILIVEDNKINQQVTKEILEKINVHCIIKENGQEAVDYLINNKNSINLIFMDLQMPVLDGFEATTKIREITEYKNTPIIALTADIMQESKNKLFHVGMNDFLLKPFKPESLYKKVHQWAGIRSLNKITIDKNRFIDFSFLCSEINIEKGLLFTSGSEQLYKKLLIDFSNNYKDFFIDFSENIKNNTETAARQLHALKGASGTLGMTNIQCSAEKLEDFLKSGKHEKDYNELYISLKNSLNRVNDSISELNKKNENILDNKIKVKTYFEIIEDLEKLKQLVEKYDPGIKSSFDTLKNKYSGIIREYDLKSLELVIKKYDFTNALIIVDVIIAYINSRK